MPNSSDVFVFVGFTSLKNIEHQRENMHVANMHKEESIMHRCTNSIASKSLFENCESTQFHWRDAGHFLRHFKDGIKEKLFLIIMIRTFSIIV